MRNSVFFTVSCWSDLSIISLINSSNMGTAKLALSVPKEFLLDRFFDAGFAESTGTELVGERTGMKHAK